MGFFFKSLYQSLMKLGYEGIMNQNILFNSVYWYHHVSLQSKRSQMTDKSLTISLMGSIPLYNLSLKIS